MLYIVWLFIANVKARSDKSAMHDVCTSYNYVVYKYIDYNFYINLYNNINIIISILIIVFDVYVDIMWIIYYANAITGINMLLLCVTQLFHKLCLIVQYANSCIIWSPSFLYTIIQMTCAYSVISFWMWSIFRENCFAYESNTIAETDNERKIWHMDTINSILLSFLDEKKIGNKVQLYITRL